MNLQTELGINTYVTVLDTHTMVSNLHRNLLKGQEGTDDQHRVVSDPRAL